MKFSGSSFFYFYNFSLFSYSIFVFFDLINHRNVMNRKIWTAKCIKFYNEGVMVGWNQELDQIISYVWSAMPFIIAIKPSQIWYAHVQIICGMQCMALCRFLFFLNKLFYLLSSITVVNGKAQHIKHIINFSIPHFSLWNTDWSRNNFTS